MKYTYSSRASAHCDDVTSRTPGAEPNATRWIPKEHDRHLDPYEEFIMTLRTNALVAACAAFGCSFALAAFAQEPPPEETAPDPATQQDPSAQDPATSGDVEEPAQQQDPAQATAPESTATTESLPEEKINQFADAYIAVQTIQQKAATELQTAKDPEAANKVKASAESDMIAAVEKTGMQVPEFNRIVEMMASNNEVRSRVAAKLQERSGGG
jgi:hypothetical protein